MLRIFQGRSLLMKNYLNYSSSIPEKSVGNSKTDLIFLKKEGEVPVAPLCVPVKSMVDSSGKSIFLCCFSGAI